MKKIVLFISIAFLLSSCNSGTIFSGYFEFSDILWHQSNQPEFTFQIDKEEICNIDIELRIVHGYPYRNMKLDMLLVNGQGTEKIIPVDFKVRDESDAYLGDEMGDLIDIVAPIISDTTLAKGNYKIRLDQTLEEETLPFVMEIGIKVNRKALE